MSKWEETLLDRQAMLGCSLIGKYCFSDVEDIIKETCIHQAEISSLDFQKGVEAGRELGRREVVEWIKDNCIGDPRVVGWVRLEPEALQAKLKEWGIDNR